MSSDHTVLFCALLCRAVWPDDHTLEKLDHLGIVLLIVGTPVTQMLVRPGFPQPHVHGPLADTHGAIMVQLTSSPVKCRGSSSSLPEQHRPITCRC